MASADTTDARDALAYLVRQGDDGMLIDCGCGGSVHMILDATDQIGVPRAGLGKLVLTHGHIDHIGGANEIRSLTGCDIAAHEGDCRAMETGDAVRTAASMYGMSLSPISIDEKLSCSKGTICAGTVEIEWAHTPGHTPGSIVLYLQQPEGLVVFGQDIHGPFSVAFGSDIGLWRKSMNGILERGPDILCEGHAGVISGADRAAAFIRQQLSMHSG